MDAIVAGKQEKTEGSLVFKTYATATLTTQTNSQTDVYYNLPKNYNAIKVVDKKGNITYNKINEKLNHSSGVYGSVWYVVVDIFYETSAQIQITLRSDLVSRVAVVTDYLTSVEIGTLE